MHSIPTIVVFIGGAIQTAFSLPAGFIRAAPTSTLSSIPTSSTNPWASVFGGSSGSLGGGLGSLFGGSSGFASFPLPSIIPSTTPSPVVPSNSTNQTTPSTPFPSTATTDPFSGFLGGGSGSSGSSTENDVVSNTGCKNVTLIFARGTSELGNMGTVVGPPFATALESAIGSVAVQGVDYAASISGDVDFTTFGSDSGPVMVSLANKALAQCPSTKIVLSGYSQGAFAAHNALKNSSLDASSISSVVLFGDAEKSLSPITNVPNLLEFCASGDSVCGGTEYGGATGSGHLSYGGDVGTAAAFVKKAAGL